MECGEGGEDLAEGWFLGEGGKEGGFAWGVAGGLIVVGVGVRGGCWEGGVVEEG